MDYRDARKVTMSDGRNLADEARQILFHRDGEQFLG